MCTHFLMLLFGCRKECEKQIHFTISIKDVHLERVRF